MATTTTRPLPLASAALGVVALGLLLAVSFLEAERTRAWVFWVSLIAAFAAIVLAAVSRLQVRHERPTVKPPTRMGRWAVGLAAAGFVLLSVGPVLASVLQDSGTEPTLVIASSGLLAVGALIAAGVCALVAWFRRGERSLLVLLSLVPALLALFLLIGEFVFPH